MFLLVKIFFHYFWRIKISHLKSNLASKICVNHFVNISIVSSRHFCNKFFTKLFTCRINTKGRQRINIKIIYNIGTLISINLNSYNSFGRCLTLNIWSNTYRRFILWRIKVKKCKSSLILNFLNQMSESPKQRMSIPCSSKIVNKK